jgi:hypothetical protein
MNHSIPCRRRMFGIALTAGVGTLVRASASERAGAGTQPPRPVALPGDLVRAFVGVAHGDFAEVQRLIEVTPSLLNAAWDWGGGDFETAIGAAGHMGRRDIAEFLLARGARMDLYVAAMLGRLDLVKGQLAAYPASLKGRGPHGLTLLHHAKQGGMAAASVVTYLQSLSEG